MGADHGQHDVGAVTGGDHGHCVGQPLQDVLGGHPGDQHAHHFASQQRLITLDQGAIDGLLQVGHRRRDQERLRGQHIGLRSDLLQRCRDGLQLRRLAAVGDDSRGVRVLGRQFSQTQLDDLDDLVWGAALGPHRQHHRRAEVDRDAGVDAQLTGARHVRIVAADDQHGVAVFGHGMEAVHDIGDRDVGILVQLLVTHAHALLIGESGGGVGQQQFQDVVAVLAEPGDGSKHPDPGHRRGQPVQDAQRDRRLAGVTLGGGYIDRRNAGRVAVGHRISLSPSRQLAQPAGQIPLESSRSAAGRARARGTPGG
jgi:hypothetical protein